MNTLYLWINVLTLLFPLAFSFDRKVAFYKKWQALFPAIVLTGGFFILWDYFFTLAGVWDFNPDYIIGIYVKNLPLEELLFFFTVPYACMFIYECLIAYFPNGFKQRVYWLYIPLFFLLQSLLMLFFLYTKMYSAAVSVLLIFMAGLKPVRNKEFLRFFIPAYLLSLLPMFLVNGLLTAKPVVIYNSDEFSGIRLGTIPLEDFFYNLAMLMMCALLYEFFKPKKKETEDTHHDLTT